MLDRQLEQFGDEDRLAAAVLGLLGWTSRVEALAMIPRADGGAAVHGSLTELFLGLISVGRTLRGTLTVDGPRPERTAVEERAEEADLSRTSLLR
jgi:hypothetical protein